METEENKIERAITHIICNQITIQINSDGLPDEQWIAAKEQLKLLKDKLKDIHNHKKENYAHT